MGCSGKYGGHQFECNSKDLVLSVFLNCMTLVIIRF